MAITDISINRISFNSNSCFNQGVEEDLLIEVKVTVEKFETSRDKLILLINRKNINFKQNPSQLSNGTLNYLLSIEGFETFAPFHFFRVKALSNAKSDGRAIKRCGDASREDLLQEILNQKELAISAKVLSEKDNLNVSYYQLRKLLNERFEYDRSIRKWTEL